MHNHNQYLYKLDPCRNSVVISSTKIYDYNIINNQIKKIINFLDSIGFTNNCEIKCNIYDDTYSWSLKYIGDFNHDNIDILLTDSNLRYCSINNIIYINKMMIDKIGDEIIYYNALSFRQPDDYIKYKIYDILISNVINKKLYFIGGEMVFYNKLLKPLEYIMITDYQSIYDDALYNFQHNEDNIFLINYLSDKLINTTNDFTVIANTSKNGLQSNLCHQLLSLKFQQIIIISCNKKSFDKDFIILSSIYKLSSSYVLSTNYSVTIYFLSC